MESKINLKKLRDDFSARLADEIKNKKQDEIRFRTLGDPRISYDQYSELLKGAHLIPVKNKHNAEIKKRYKQEVHYTDYDDYKQPIDQPAFEQT